MSITAGDKHDFDKLGRWHESLSKGQESCFPVHIIFLVSAEDSAAHGMFRKFRSSFEARSARFSNLVIFGQHDVSTTVKELLSGFSLNSESVPVLIIFEQPSSNIIYPLPLTGGKGMNDDRRWIDLLAKVEQLTDKGGTILELASDMGINGHIIASKSINELTSNALDHLS